MSEFILWHFIQVQNIDLKMEMMAIIQNYSSEQEI